MMKHTRPAALLCTVPGRLIIKMHLLFFIIEIMCLVYSVYAIPPFKGGPQYSPANIIQYRHTIVLVLTANKYLKA